MTEELVKEKEIPILDTEVFTQYDDFEGKDFIGDDGDSYIFAPRHQHSIRFDKDSYIFLFEGRRGGGKTTYMTFLVVRAIALYNMRLVSNYPIEFMLRRHRPDGKTYLQHVKSEPLDFEKLLTQDEDYQHALICIDEAPDIISHMASLSWRNRLIAAFTRQIRKNYNTLFLAAQSENWIDKSMRWQIDVRLECHDAARSIGDGSALDNGEMLFVTIYDDSGQWTGKSTEDRLRCGTKPYVMRRKIFPRILWGDEDHKSVFNSWYQIDVLDSLRRVDLKLSAIKIGDHGRGGEQYPVSVKTLQSALSRIDYVYQEMPDEPNIWQPNFYASLGGLTAQDKNNLSKLLPGFNVEIGRDHSNGKRWYGFGSFDIDGFRRYVEDQAGKNGEQGIDNN